MRTPPRPTSPSPPPRPRFPLAPLPRRAARWIALSVVSACAALNPFDPGPRRVVLVDFEQARDAARVGDLRDTCPYAASGDARYRIVTDEAGGNNHVLRLNYTLSPNDWTPPGIAVALVDVDASRFDHLELRLRSDATSAAESAARVGLRRPEPGRRNMIQNASAMVTGVTSNWRTFSIPLRSMLGISEWSHLNRFYVTPEPNATAQHGAFLIDDIALVRTDEAPPPAQGRPATPRKDTWVETAERNGGAAAARRDRLAGWPARLLVPRTELPVDDRALLRRLASDTWRGLDSLRDREHGLPVDTVSLGESPSADHAQIGDYTNVTNIGVYLLAVAAAHELELIDRDTARQRVSLVLDTLEHLDAHHGFFFNYYDTTSLERTSNFVSFVDSAWLTAGLIVIRNALPELASRATALIERGDFSFFYDRGRGLMSHGVFTNLELPSEYHYGLLYTEARLGSLIAIGKGDVPPVHWQRLLRVFPPECDWQTQQPRDGTYEWRGLRFLPSWGGSMFEALMPFLVVDEQRWSPRGLGPNGVVHATIQRRWAEELTRTPVWGNSPSRQPDGGYREYGVPVLGVRGYDGVVVTPYAAALALAVTPEEAVADLRRLVELYDLYGDFGLYDAVDPASGRVARDYLALDQGMILVSLANYLKPHCVQDLFAADPIAQRALPLLAQDDFFH